MSPAEIIQAERRELARLWRECHVTMCFCEHCGRDEWAAVDGDDVICLRCAKLRIESMAEAADDVRGRAAGESAKKLAGAGPQDHP